MHLIAFRNGEMRRKRNKFGVLSLPFSSSPWQSAVLCRLYLRTGSSLATRNFSLLNFHLLNGVFRGKTTTGKWGKMREAVRWIMHEFVSPQKPFKSLKGTVIIWARVWVCVIKPLIWVHSCVCVFVLWMATITQTVDSRQQIAAKYRQYMANIAVQRQQLGKGNKTINLRSNIHI